jgi:glutamate dehydrogenase (NAD(P)+)
MAELVCKAVWGPEVLGYLVIDTLVGGRSCGGVRMLPDIDEAEIRGLARAMTLKYGFLGLPQGGAKAGLLGNPEAPQADRQYLLKRFAESIAPLLSKRIFAPATDMGTCNADIRLLLETAGYKPKRRELQGTCSGYYTALTVIASAKQALRRIGATLSGCSVAIEGFGRVGSALSRLLGQAGAKIVAVSTSRGTLFNSNGLDVARLLELSERKSSWFVEDYREAEHLSPAELLEAPVDLLCPCARHHSIHLTNAPRVTARVICPGANNPLTPEAEQLLFKRGTLCLPDFVANSGGVLGGTMEFASINPAEIATFIDYYFGAEVGWILEQSSSRGVLPREVAVPLAMDRMRDLQQAARRRSIQAVFLSWGLEFHRRSWIPPRLVAPLAMVYFRRRVGDPGQFDE